MNEIGTSLPNCAKMVFTSRFISPFMYLTHFPMRWQRQWMLNTVTIIETNRMALVAFRFVRFAIVIRLPLIPSPYIAHHCDVNSIHFEFSTSLVEIRWLIFVGSYSCVLAQFNLDRLVFELSPRQRDFQTASLPSPSICYHNMSLSLSLSLSNL